MASGRDKFIGKKKRIFKCPETINTHLYCPICLEVFEDPQRLSCGHTFCYICIQNCVKSQHKHICPECKSDFSRRKLEKDFLASKMVDDLEVRCVHDGCKYVCKNSIIKKHQRCCEHRPKKDSNIGGEVFQIDQQCQQIIEVLGTSPMNIDKRENNLVYSSRSEQQSSFQVVQSNP